MVPTYFLFFEKLLGFKNASYVVFTASLAAGGGASSLAAPQYVAGNTLNTASKVENVAANSETKIPAAAQAPITSGGTANSATGARLADDPCCSAS